MVRGIPRPALAAAATLALASAIASPSDQARASAPQDCFWTSTFDEKSSNVAYPDTAVNYYLGRVNLPPGGEMLLRGRFPHARYMSFNAYDEAGRPTDALADSRIAPDRGSANPFRAGRRRDVARRAYTVRVVAEPAPRSPRRRAPNTVYLGTDGRPIHNGSVIYRVYLPDRGRDQFGGTGLPEVALRLPDGAEVDQPAACSAPTHQPSTGVNDADRRSGGPTTPSLSTAGPHLDWERFFNIPRSVVRAASEQGAAATPADQQGGFFSDRNNAYVYAFTSREHGDVLVLRGRLPRVTHTYDRDRVFRRAPLRYWSMCDGTILPTGATETVDCLYDEQVRTSRRDRFTIVVSTPEDRPDNARAACGVGWMAWGARPDGVVIMRNQMPAPRFARAIQRVERPGQEKKVLGPYLPRGTYTDTARFESRGC